MTTLFATLRKGPDPRGEDVSCNSEEMMDKMTYVYCQTGQ